MKFFCHTSSFSNFFWNQIFFSNLVFLNFFYSVKSRKISPSARFKSFRNRTRNKKDTALSAKRMFVTLHCFNKIFFFEFEKKTILDSNAHTSIYPFEVESKFLYQLQLGHKFSSKGFLQDFQSSIASLPNIANHSGLCHFKPTTVPLPIFERKKMVSNKCNFQSENSFSILICYQIVWSKIKIMFFYFFIHSLNREK